MKTTNVVDDNEDSIDEEMEYFNLGLSEEDTTSDDDKLKDKELQTSVSFQMRGVAKSSGSKLKRIKGGKIVVRYNKRGVPYGQEAAELATYLGVLARTSVPITIKDWRMVPKDFKDMLWQCVQVLCQNTLRLLVFLCSCLIYW